MFKTHGQISSYLPKKTRNMMYFKIKNENCIYYDLQ